MGAPAVAGAPTLGSHQFQEDRIGLLEGARAHRPHMDAIAQTGGWARVPEAEKVEEEAAGEEPRPGGCCGFEVCRAAAAVARA